MQIIERNLIYVVIFLIILIPKNIYSCTCGWLGGILKTSQFREVVIHGKVLYYIDSTEYYNIKKIPLKMAVEVIDLIKGGEKRDTIMIWGDDGSDCRPYLSMFKEKSEWIFVLDSFDNGEYGLSYCGEFYVPIIDEKVKGAIIYNDQCTIKSKEELVSISVEELKKRMLDHRKYIKPTRECYGSDKDLYIDVNNMPEYKLGEKSFLNYLRNGLKELGIIFKQKRGSELPLDIIIEKDGTISQVKDYPNATKLYNEVKKLIYKTSGDWIPGSHHGKNYRVRMRFKVKVANLLK